MIFPFESLSGDARQAGLVAGTLIGFGFGFVLERAGFGRAQKLAAQFYGTDLTVLKVMFGAIVTAMLGMVVLDGVGALDFKAVADQAASGTFVWPMLVGGFALGVGFIVSGYCPGTSFVAAASGKLDGLAVVAGVIVGQVAYAELEWRPFLARFHNSGDLGHKYLWELARLPPAVVAVAVVALAVGAFVFADKVEKWRSASASPMAQGRPAGRPGRVVFAGFATAALAGLALLALPAQGRDTSRAPEAISAAQLARRVLEEPWTVRVIDLRSREECAAQRVPGAECIPLGDPALELAEASPEREVVLVGASQLSFAPPGVAAYRGRVLALGGGFAAWHEFALQPPAALAAQATPAERETYRLRAGLNAAITGMKAAPPPPAATGAAAAPKKGGGGCGG